MTHYHNNNTNHKTITSDKENIYYEQLAEDAHAEEEYRKICQYGPCHDDTWQQGIQI